MEDKLQRFVTAPDNKYASIYFHVDKLTMETSHTLTYKLNISENRHCLSFSKWYFNYNIHECFYFGFANLPNKMILFLCKHPSDPTKYFYQFLC